MARPSVPAAATAAQAPDEPDDELAPGVAGLAGTSPSAGSWRFQCLDRKAVVSKMSGETMEFVMEHASLAAGLRSKICEHWHVPLLCQELVLDGKPLADGDPLFAQVAREQDSVSISLILSHERLAQVIADRTPKAREDTMQAMAQWSLKDYGSATAMLRQVLEKITAGCFTQVQGFIPRYDDVHTEVMTLDDAKARVFDLPGCAGFTFKGEVTDAPVKVFFKSKTAIKEGSWTTFIVKRVDGRPSFLIRELICLKRTMTLLKKFVEGEDTEENEAELRRQLSTDLMRDQSFLVVAQLLLKVLPSCIPIVIEQIVSRMLDQAEKVGEAQMVKALSKYSAEGDERCIAVYCKCISSRSLDIQVVAAKALNRHAPKGHENSLKALMKCIARLGSKVPGPVVKALGKLAPQGHAKSIETLQSCLDKNLDILQRWHPDAKVQLEASLRLLRGEATPQKASAREGQPCAGARAWSGCSGHTGPAAGAGAAGGIRRQPPEEDWNTPEYIMRLPDDMNPAQPVAAPPGDWSRRPARLDGGVAAPNAPPGHWGANVAAGPAGALAGPHFIPGPRGGVRHGPASHGRGAVRALPRGPAGPLPVYV